MFGLERKDWKTILFGAIAGLLISDAVHWIVSIVWGLDWAGTRGALKSANLQAWIVSLLVPGLLLALYVLVHRGRLSFEVLAKIVFCGMASGYLIVFLFNLGRPNNDLMKQITEDPLSSFPIFFIPIFYLMHSVLKSIVRNEV